MGETENVKSKHHMLSGIIMGKRVNNVDLELLKANAAKASEKEGHFDIEKQINGDFHMNGSPMFTAELMSENAKFIMGADEPTVLGGMGIHATPLNYLMFGVMSCFASTVAIQAARKGITLERLKVRGHLYYDIGPVLMDSDYPIIKAMKLEIDSDKDLQEVIKLSVKVCPALFAIANPIKTEVVQI
ncbi:OsmC family protein [Oxyplasma meridianum]|uniref:OsmC family protein n=1 Tax=Oxyplasma meridianum TaxID=3073602 RepID=A0AAX4NEG6_9ARCH